MKTLAFRTQKKVILMKQPKTKNKISFKNFVRKESKSIGKEDSKKLLGKQKRLKKILTLGVFSKQKEKLKLLIEILKEYHKGNYKKIPWRSIAAISFTLLYIINPIDMIPDVLPLLGYVDDLSVFMGLLKLIEKDVNDYKSWKIDKLEIENK